MPFPAIPRIHPAEQGEGQGGAQAVAALCGQQGAAQGGAVGGDGGQVVVQPPGQLQARGDAKQALRTCIHNLKRPSGRAFCRLAALKNLEIHKGFP